MKIPVHQALHAVRGRQADEVGPGPQRQGPLPLLFFDHLQRLPPEPHHIPAPRGGRRLGVRRLDDLVQAHPGKIPADRRPRPGQAPHRQPEVRRHPPRDALRGLAAEAVRPLVPL